MLQARNHQPGLPRKGLSSIVKYHLKKQFSGLSKYINAWFQRRIPQKNESGNVF